MTWSCYLGLRNRYFYKLWTIEFVGQLESHVSASCHFWQVLTKILTSAWIQSENGVQKFGGEYKILETQINQENASFPPKVLGCKIVRRFS